MEVFFYKAKENVLESQKNQSNGERPESNLQKIQDAFLKVLDNKNLSFLLGSGCSSFEIETVPSSPEPKSNPEEANKNEAEQGIPEPAKATVEQIGIPVMAPLAKEFYSSEEFKEKKEWLKAHLSIDVTDNTFCYNLEVFLSTLHSLSFYHSKKTKTKVVVEDATSTAVAKEDAKANKSEAEGTTFSKLGEAEKIDSIILMARNFLLVKCLNEKNITPSVKGTSNDNPLIELYKQFYRKLLTRNSTLPRLNIFTTNYDLYSERAMDLLGIHYVNGFTGGISKFFNPAIFNYALAEKMDLSQSKWSVIDNLFYLYKIHGSVNWIEGDGENKLFKVKEINEPNFDRLKEEDTIMIHPTPLKYNASLGSPYSDLFREFQKKLMQNNNILVTIGYSFSDEHINNLIFQAFTIPSFRLIVIGEPTSKNAIGKLMELNDSRIWIIGERWPDGKDRYIPLHFFKRFVEEVLPDLTAEDLDNKMEKTIQNLKNLLS
jgi:hypothetical protein